MYSRTKILYVPASSEWLLKVVPSVDATAVAVAVLPCREENAVEEEGKEGGVEHMYSPLSLTVFLVDRKSVV